MGIEFGLTSNNFNTEYAPLATLLAYYQQNQILEPLQKVKIAIKTRDFSPTSKLEQVLISILAGCEYLVEVNTKLKPETELVRLRGLERFADQSTLSSTIDALSLMNIEQLVQATGAIWQLRGRTLQHDWRGFLWLDFDLSGLPCGKQGEKAKKGYFSGKKTWLGVN